MFYACIFYTRQSPFGQCLKTVKAFYIPEITRVTVPFSSERNSQKGEIYKGIIICKFQLHITVAKLSYLSPVQLEVQDVCAFRVFVFFFLNSISGIVGYYYCSCLKFEQQDSILKNKNKTINKHKTKVDQDYIFKTTIFVSSKGSPKPRMINISNG